MRLSKIGEFGLIHDLQGRCQKDSSGLIAGIGDDAAIVDFKKAKALFTKDMLLEGVHFDLSTTTFEQLGHKFLAVNISDIFAMGGTPEYFLIGLGLPGSVKKRDIDDLYTGILKVAEQYGVTVIGGDTCSSANGIVLSGTLIGRSAKPISRAGARPGDGIYVTGTLGDSAMGLTLLKKRKKRMAKFNVRSSASQLIKSHLMPEPAALVHAVGVTAMIDISDGLLIDLGHICDESDVGAIVEKERIPLSEDLTAAASGLGHDPYDYAMKGGEDYVLLFTAPVGHKTGAHKIGEVIKKGRYLVDEKGSRMPFKAEGFDHFK